MLDDVLTRADAMADQLADSSDSARELQRGFDQQALYTEVLKTSHQAFKEA